MKKTYLRAAIGCLVLAIFGMAVTFTACKKDADLLKKGSVKNATECGINDGFDPKGTYTTRGNENDGWNAINDFVGIYGHTTYNFWLTTDGNDHFLSFCGNYGSSGIGEVAGVDYLEPAQHAAIVGVLNYINDIYGSIDQWTFESYNYQNTPTANPSENTKLIAQYAIWRILNDENVVISKVPAIDDAVEEVLANGKTATGNINIYFMVGANFPNDIGGIQPQIVPFCEPEITFSSCPTEGFNWFGNFTIYNGYNEGAYVLGCNVLNGNGHVFPIRVSYNGNAYPSFCANAGSTNFDETPGAYGVNEVVDMPSLLNTFNYIKATYGSIDSWSGNINSGVTTNTRVLSQIMTWHLYNGVDFACMTDKLPADLKAAVQNVLANGPTFTGNVPNGEYEYLVYLVSNLQENITLAQPQIVPVCENCEVSFHSLNFWDAEHGLVDFFGHLLEDGQGHNLHKLDLTAGFYRLLENMYVADLGYTDGANHFVDSTCCELPEMSCELWSELADVIASVENENQGHTNWEYHTVYYKWLKKKVQDALEICNPHILGPEYGSVTATQKGNVPNIIASLNPKNGNPQDPQSFNAGVVYGSNHFCYATFTRAQLEAGAELDFVVGNKFQIVGKGTAKIEGGNIVVTIDKFGKGSFGVMAFNKNMVTQKFPKNGNIHSQKAADLMDPNKGLGATTGFDHNNKLVVPCPTGNTIYLYIHCGSINFFL